MSVTSYGSIYCYRHHHRNCHWRHQQRCSLGYSDTTRKGRWPAKPSSALGLPHGDLSTLTIANASLLSKQPPLSRTLLLPFKTLLDSTSPHFIFLIAQPRPYQSNGTKEKFHSSWPSARYAQEQRMNETWWNFMNFSRKSNFQWNWGGAGQRNSQE